MIKKIAAVLTAFSAVLLVAAPASADVSWKIAQGSDNCGSSNEKSLDVDSYQERRDNGTPANQSDDEINFSNGISTDVTARVGVGDAAHLAYRIVQVFKKTNNGPEVLWTGVYYSEDRVLNVNVGFDNWVDVGKEPRVHVEAAFDYGALCQTNAAWNNDWE